MRDFRIPLAAIALFLTFIAPCLAEVADATWPHRILVTNDNGIDDVATRELARALADEAEVYLVAASEDRSGTSNLLSCTRSGRFVVEPRDIGEGVRAWALDGYPADCVVFALAGPMVDAPPDLVVSGINGGANLADAWFGSGTIGAARTAAYLGVPAVAVSGVEDDDPESVAAAVEWVVDLVHSGILQRIRPPSYLTVSLPVGSPSPIDGIEVVDRARGLVSGEAHLTPDPSGSAGKDVWTFTFDIGGRPGTDTDVAAVTSGHIAIVPMRVGDTDPEMLAWLRANADMLPDWPRPPPER